MKKFICAFYGFLYAFCPFVSGASDVFGMFDNTGITDEDIYVTGSVIIKNYGTLNGTIHTNGYSVRIENYGQINSEFDAPNTALITQVVTGVDGLNKIHNLSGHIIEVNTSDEIDMANFINMISGANKVNVESGIFIVGPNVPDNDVQINVGNTTVFYIDGIPSDLSKPLVSGIYNSGTPFIGQINIDPMYIVTPRLSGDALYLDVVRQTDYSTVVDNELGNFLDELRTENPDDKLLSVLDGVNDRATINNILSQSARTNPIKLMDAVRSIHTFYDTMAMDDIAFGVVARPFYIYSGDFSFIGGAGNLGGAIGDNTIGTIGFIGGMLRYNGDYDRYNGALYGGNIGVRYMDDDFYLRAFGSLSYAQFDGIDVFDGHRMVHNVHGLGGVATTDFGMVFAAMQELKLVPFVGVRGDWASVLNDNDFDTSFRAGLIANVDTDTDGNKYKFGAQLLAQTDGSIYGGIYTDMMSTVDGVGGGVSVGVLYDDIGWSYKLELNIKFEF